MRRRAPRLPARRATASLLLGAWALACLPPHHPEVSARFRAFPATARIERTCLVVLDAPPRFETPLGLLSVYSIEVPEHAARALRAGLHRTFRWVRIGGSPGAVLPSKTDPMVLRVRIDGISRERSGLRVGIRIQGRVALETGEGHTSFEQDLEGYATIPWWLSSLDSYSALDSVFGQALKDFVNETNQVVFARRGLLP